MSEISAKHELMSFLATMRDWESRNFQALSVALDNEDSKLGREIKNQAKQELEAILERFCIPGKGDRRRLISVSLKSPTTYDSDRDNLGTGVQHKGSVIYTYQQREGLGTKIRFTLNEHEKSWKILKAEFFSALDSKWLGWTL